MTRFIVSTRREFDNLSYGGHGEDLRKIGVLCADEAGDRLETDASLTVVLTLADIRGLMVKLVQDSMSYAVFVYDDHHSHGFGRELQESGISEAFPGRVFWSGPSFIDAQLIKAVTVDS